MNILQLVDLLPEIEDALALQHNVVRVANDAEALEQAARPDGLQIDAVITNGHHGVPSALIAALPALKLIGIYGVGYDRVDLTVAHAREILVTNTPDVLTDDVADLAIAMMLNVQRRLPFADVYARAGDWRRKGELALATKASGKRYGIVGMGRIGAAIAARLAGFGGSIAYTSRRPRELPHTFHASAALLAAEVDVLFVAAAASASSTRLIDREVLAALGPRGVVINIACGSVVDQDALVEMLVNGELGGAGLDVFAAEPEIPEALTRLPNVVLSPHIGAATHETRLAMGELLLANLEAFARGGSALTPVETAPVSSCEIKEASHA